VEATAGAATAVMIARIIAMRVIGLVLLI